MAYVTRGFGSLGCSVQELQVGGSPTVNELKKLQESHGGVTICVTSSGYQKSSETTLKKAGFIPLIEYPNHAYGHAGNLCRLWARVKKRRKVIILPDGEAVKKAAPKKKVALKKAAAKKIVKKGREKVVARVRTKKREK